MKNLVNWLYENKISLNVRKTDDNSQASKQKTRC